MAGVDAADVRAEKERQALAKYIDSMGKPSAVARHLGVSRPTVDYWLRTFVDSSESL